MNSIRWAIVRNLRSNFVVIVLREEWDPFTEKRVMRVCYLGGKALLELVMSGSSVHCDALTTRMMQLFSAPFHLLTRNSKFRDKSQTREAVALTANGNLHPCTLDNLVASAILKRPRVSLRSVACEFHARKWFLYTFRISRVYHHGCLDWLLFTDTFTFFLVFVLKPLCRLLKSTIRNRCTWQ